MDPILALALVTFALIIGYLIWNRASHARGKQPTSGVGGPNDPLAGNAPGIRSPDAIRADLDTAKARDDATGGVGPAAGREP